MRLSPALVATAAFASAAGLALAGALAVAQVVERRTNAEVTEVLRRDGLDWASATTDGLQVHLAGTAPNEAQRFRALNLTGSIVGAGRIRDGMDVTPAQALEAPRFSVELLRNDDGISLIGLVPAGEGPSTLAAEVAAIAEGATVADMLTEADFAPPADWDRALDYGLSALKLLPRSKISIAADGVAITAIAGSEAEKRRLETDLARSRPEGIPVSIDISAPRPVLTPFTLRFVKDEAGARFDACAADTELAREVIVAAAVAGGLEGKAACIIGLGVPTPRWAEATAAGIRAIGELGGGTITFADADVTLLAAIDTPQATFDRVVGELETALPDVFSLKATLPEKPETDVPEGPPEFTATLSAEGKVELRGRLTDVAQRDAMTSFARARFGADDVYVATRLDPDLPDGWPVRVLAGLAALSELHEGAVVVRSDAVSVTGVTGSTDAQAAISRILSGQLGQGQAFDVKVTYDKRFDPLAGLPTPQECIRDLNAVLAARKITFAPGSAEIEAEAGGTMDALAEIMRRCPDIPMEIAGHTDSQGKESTNLALSQARAEAVLLGLQGRRVLVGALSAVGYGEGRPIADNGSEDGREANRRIEFSLVGPAAEPAAPEVAPPGVDAASDTPLAAVPVVVPVNADADAPGAQRPRGRPDTAAAGTVEEKAPAADAEDGDGSETAAPARPAAAPAGARAENAPPTGPDATESEPRPGPKPASPAASPAQPTARAPAQDAPATPVDAGGSRVVASSDVTEGAVISSSEADGTAGAVSGASSAPRPPEPEEPFVSAAPQGQTVRPAGRPATP